MLRRVCLFFLVSMILTACGSGDSEPVVVEQAGVAAAPAGQGGDVSAIEPVALEPEELYRQFVPNPAEIPAECWPDGEREPGAAERIAFERAFAEAAVERYGMPEDANLEEEFAKHADMALFTAYRLSLENAAVITPEEIAEFFEENQARFHLPARAWFDFFFVPAGTGETVPPEGLLQLEAMAAEGAGLEELREAAEGLGVQVSPGRSSGFEGRLSPAINDPIFATEPGSFSAISRTATGWHWFYVHEVEPAQLPDLERDTPRIREALTAPKAQELRQEVQAYMRAQLEAEGREDAGELPGTELEQIYTRRLYADRLEEIERFEEVLRNNTLVWAFETYLMRTAEVPSAEVEAEYEAKRERYVSRTEYGVVEARVAIPEAEEFASAAEHERAVAEIRERLTAWKAKLEERGAALLDAHPEELGLPVSMRDWGTQPQGPRGPTLDLATQDLEPGEYSEVVESRRGLHLYMLTERVEPRQLTLEEAREQIERGLRMLKGRERYVELACSVGADVFG